MKQQLCITLSSAFIADKTTALLACFPLLWGGIPTFQSRLTDKVKENSQLQKTPFTTHKFISNLAIPLNHTAFY